MPNNFQRPGIPYTSPAGGLQNNDRYKLIADANKPVSGDMLDGDVNYLIDAVNTTYDFAGTIAAGAIPGSNNPANVDRFPITDGLNPNPTISWSKINPTHFSAQCIPSSAFQPGSITTQCFAAASVTSAKLAFDAVDDTTIVDRTISFNKITVENNENFWNFFNAQNDNSLSGSKISDATLSGLKLIDNTVPGSKITTGTLPSTAIANDSITRSQLAPVIKPLIGQVVDWAGASGVAAPAGYLECNGQSVLKATYADLFNAIGTTWGASTGTNFSVPDLRGVSTHGIDPSSGSPTNNKITIGSIQVGAMAGTETHVLTVLQMPAHSHTYNTIPNVDYPVGDGGGVLMPRVISSQTTSQTGGGQAHNNMSPYALIRKLIYAGV